MKWQLSGKRGAMQPHETSAQSLTSLAGSEAEIDKYLALKTAIHRKLLDRINLSLLDKLSREQIEEESTARTLLAKVRRCEGAPGALLILENELAARGTGLPGSEDEEEGDKD